MEEIITILTSPEIQAKILPLKIAGIAIFLLFLGAIIFFLFRTKWMKYRYFEDMIGFLSYRPLGVGKMMKRWAGIIKKFESGTEYDQKTALLEAEELMDEVLERMVQKGETTEEKLENLPLGSVSNLSQIKEALKMKNSIVRDPGYKLNKEEAELALKAFEQALKDLQVF